MPPRALLSIALFVLACTTAAHAPAPGTGTLFGTLRLVPHQGVEPATTGSAGYDDPRLRHARHLDYSRPGFAVVYVESPTAPPTTVEFVIRDTPTGPALHPRQLAIGTGSVLRVRNESSEQHIISLPRAGLLERLAPGAGLETALLRAGASPLFLLDAPEVEALVFVAPGRFATVSGDGRWELPNLPPGPARLFAWHARFPRTELDVDVLEGERQELALEVGVDVGPGRAR